MEEPASSLSPSSSSPPSNWEHDVFLSFRGKDTRHGFTDHLYFALKQRRIDTYRDAEKLPRGTYICSELVEAIQESRFAIVVFSANYAASRWCLDELAYILDCKKLRGLEVLPVFYHVEPSVVRKQVGEMGMEIAKYEMGFEEKKRKLDKWKEALKEVASLSGWHVANDRGESEVVQEIVNEISNKLNNILSTMDRDLIGMDVRIETVECYLDLRSTDIRAVGIWGMGGIGKTTLAKEVFKKIRSQFDVSGFVSNVRLYSEEKSLVELQKLLCGSFFGDSNINIDTVETGIRLLKKVLHKKKVLIILDDIDELKQLKYLAPGMDNRETSWVSGSRLIITTRDRRILTECGVPEYNIYEVEKLSDAEGFQLICQQAFKKNHPPVQFVELSNSFVKYAGGLPLAHKVLGSHLSGREIDEWLEVLYRLDEDLDKDIFSVLRISFDGLHESDKKIFLDIACFFNGEDHVRVKKILKGCGFSSGIGITNLISKALIKIERKKLWMHDLLRCLGRHIVRRESVVPGKRSRLWLYDNSCNHKHRRLWHVEDVQEVITENTGTTAVEGLFLSLPEKEEMRINGDPFITMSNLRLLKIYNVDFCDVYFTCLPKNLRSLEWHECPLLSLSSCFTPDSLVSLVELNIPNSRIEEVWNGRLCLKMLILMDFSNCQYLTMTPDFSTVPNLEHLILQGCKKLSKVHHTISNLKKLGLLNLKGCTSLERLPDYISLSSLETLILSGCSTLQEFPEIVENMDMLSELYLDGTAVRELPVSMQHLKGLVLLNLSGCRNLISLPSILCSSLSSLKFLYLSLCSSMYNLPDNIGFLEHLEELDACNSAIQEVPESTSHLMNLKLLCFHGCGGVTGLKLPNKFSGLRSLTTLNLGGCNLIEGSIPDDIGHLLTLQSLDISENFFFTIPVSISELSELTEISLFKCSNLHSLPKDLPSSLRNVNLRGCSMLKNSSSLWKRYPPFMSIINCRRSEPKEEEIFPEIHKFCLGNLKKLDLSYSIHLKKIPDMSGVPILEKLNLEGCETLSEIHPTVGYLQHLEFLSLKGCVNLEWLPLSISMKSLKIFVLSGCSKLKEFPRIKGDMSSLSQLHLDGTALRHLQVPMMHLEGLTLTNLSGCRNLLTVPIIFSLKSLNLSRCSTISKLPASLANMEHLEELDASETAIKGLPQSISSLGKLKVLSFCGCKGLQFPKWFSDLRCLTSLNLRRCGLAEDVIDRLHGLSVLQILDLSGNSLSIIPSGIVLLSSLKLLNLSENNFRNIPSEIGHLYSLQVLDLSENNFISIPESISDLSDLTELHLFGCGKLETLPNKLPLSLKFVHAGECPMLNYNADILTIWPSGRRFCFINCKQSNQGDGQPKHLPLQVPVPKDNIELQFPTYIKDRVYRRRSFEIHFPHRTRVPNFWHCWENGPSVTITLPDVNRTWMGLSLFVVFEILEEDIFNKSRESQLTVCEFHTSVGQDTSLVFQDFMDFTTGSYGLCCYEPRGGKFSGFFDRPASILRASVSTKRPNLKIRGCGIHLISEEDAAEFVQSLAYQTVTQHLDTNFDQHCKDILDEGATADLMEQDSTSIVSEYSCREIKAEFRRELSLLYEGCNGYEKSFYICFTASVISTPSWFFRHHAGDVTLCCITENLYDDQRWMGLELYVQLSQFTSTLTYGCDDLSFYIDLCCHGHGNINMQESVKINSWVGTSDHLVVLHVPRVHFQQQLNQCQGISAKFKTLHAETQVLVCGSRLVFKHDLEDLTHSLTEAADTMGRYFLTQLCSHSQPDDCGDAEKAAMPINCTSWFQRDTTLEQALSNAWLRSHRCCLQRLGEPDLTQMLHYRSVSLHSKSTLKNWDGNQGNLVEENKSLPLGRHHVQIMAETRLLRSYSSKKWRRYLRLLLQQSKMANLSLGGHTISVYKNFKPSSPYSIICFSEKGIPAWFKYAMSYQMSSWSRVGIKLPPRLHLDENWRGLAICVAFEVHDEGATISPETIKILCHLRAKDSYCLDPISMCSITDEKLRSLHIRRFVWLTYIPRILLNEFSVVSDVETRIYVNCRRLKVEKCGVRFLYQPEELEFRNTIIECWLSFFDSRSFIRQLVEADELNDQPWTGGEKRTANHEHCTDSAHLKKFRHDTSPLIESDEQSDQPWIRHELSMLEGYTKVFDPDKEYNEVPHYSRTPKWFGHGIDLLDTGNWVFQLPPSLKGTNWIGLAICASYCISSFIEWRKSYSAFTLTIRNDGLPCSGYSQFYGMTDEESEFLQRRWAVNNQKGKSTRLIWISYLPRSWFPHQLNHGSLVGASLTHTWWKPEKISHRFVYARDVGKF